MKKSIEAIAVAWIFKHVRHVWDGVAPARQGAELELRLDRDAEQIVARLFDIRGHFVRTILDGPAVAGSRRIVWDGRTDRGDRAAPGVYLLRVTAGNTRAETKVMLLR